MLALMAENRPSEVERESEMPYTREHRIKFRIWQTLILLVDVLEAKTFARDMVFCENLNEINQQLQRLLKMNCTPTIRHLKEVFAIRLYEMYPELIEGIPEENVKPQVSSSYIMIGGYMLSKGTDQFRQEMQKYFLKFAVSSSPHPRCLAQYFLQGAKDLQKYFKDTKDVRKLLDKIKVELANFHSNLESVKKSPISILTLKSSGVQFGFSSAYNEFIDDSFVKTV